MENEKNFAVYDYMCKGVKAHKQTEAVDMYEAFGWEATGAAASFGGVTVSFRRDRKIKHKTELNRLERKAENLKSLIDRITASMSFGAMIFAYIFGCLAALVFGGGMCMCLLNPGGVPLLVGGILLGLAGNRSHVRDISDLQKTGCGTNRTSYPRKRGGGGKAGCGVRAGARLGCGKRLTGMLNPVKLWREYRLGDFRTRTRITALFPCWEILLWRPVKPSSGYLQFPCLCLFRRFIRRLRDLQSVLIIAAALICKEDIKKETVYYCFMAIFLLAASLVYSLYMVRLFFISSGLVYGKIAGITVAAVSFTELFMAVRGLVKSNKLNDMLVSGLKIVNLSAALTALVLTQSALLSFTSGIEIAYSYVTAAFGLCVGLVSSLLSVLMLLKARRIGRDGGDSAGKHR